MGEEWTEIHLRLFGALLHCVDGSALLYFEKRPSHPFIWHGVHLSLKSLQIISNHPWHWPPLLLPLLRQCHALEALRIVDFDEALLRALPNPLRELYIDDMCTIDELDLLWLVDEGCPSVSNLWVLGYMEGLEFGGAPPLLEEAIEEGGGVVESYERRELGAKAFLNHSYYGALASR